MKIAAAIYDRGGYFFEWVQTHKDKAWMGVHEGHAFLRCAFVVTHIQLVNGCRKVK